MRKMISGRAQLRALASPARQELLDLLAGVGPATASDLSRRLRRPADGLYYHPRALERAGLVASDRSKSPAGGNGATFRSVYAEPALLHDTSPGGNSREVSTIVGTMLRLGSRDFARAAARGDARTRKPRRELWAMRSVGWLAPADLEDVNRRMQALRDAVAGSAGSAPRGRLYGITILLTPLEHRERKKQGKKRPRRGGS